MLVIPIGGALLLEPYQCAKSTAALGQQSWSKSTASRQPGALQSLAELVSGEGGQPSFFGQLRRARCKSEVDFARDAPEGRVRETRPRDAREERSLGRAREGRRSIDRSIAHSLARSLARSLDRSLARSLPRQPPTVWRDPAPARRPGNGLSGGGGDDGICLKCPVDGSKYQGQPRRRLARAAAMARETLSEC